MSGQIKVAKVGDTIPKDSVIKGTSSFDGKDFVILYQCGGEQSMSHEDRVRDLLEANNKYQERYRASENTIASLLDLVALFPMVSLYRHKKDNTLAISAGEIRYQGRRVKGEGKHLNTAK